MEHGQANVLNLGFDVDYVLADKGYDSDRFIEALEEIDAVAVIPRRRNHQKQRKYDVELYKWRHLFENVFLHLKI